MQDNASAASYSAPADPLRIPIFRIVWITSLATNFGILIQTVGASWMMVSLSGSATMVALVQTSSTLPVMLLSLMAGAIADNMDRRLVLLAALGFMLLVSVVLAAFAALGLLTPWMLLAFTFLIGCGAALEGPAWQASVGDMVPRRSLTSAVTLNNMGYNIARSLGPAIGGLIVAAAGVATVFFLHALSYIGLMVALLRWRPDLPPRLLPRETLGRAMGTGVRYVVMSPALRVIMIRATLFSIPASALPALMPLVAHDLVAGGPLTYGILLGAFGIGAVLGAMGNGRLRKRFSTEGIMRGAAAAMMLGSAAAAVSSFLPLTMLSLALAGAGWVQAFSIFSASVQLGSPRWVVGRALALYQMFSFGGLALGAWASGAAGESLGVSNALLITAALHIIGLISGFVLPLPETEAYNVELVERWAEPETAVHVEARSGPIVIAIEYRIDPEDLIAFLNAMEERRRIRLRDGARHWTLLRDLGDDRVWLERYKVPTWLDYIRHNQRRTQADSANSDSIRELHRGPWPPVVHRSIERQTGSLPNLRSRSASPTSRPLTDPNRFG